MFDAVTKRWSKVAAMNCKRSAVGAVALGIVQYSTVEYSTLLYSTL